MTVLTGAIPTRRTDVHAPAISTAERERWAYLSLEASGALPASGIRPPRWDSWWDAAVELLQDGVLATILPLPAPYSARESHNDIAGLTADQRQGESRLCNLRLAIEEFRYRVLGRGFPSPWVTERYLRLRGGASGDR